MIASFPTYFRSPIFLRILSAIALIFGVATVISGGQVIFSSEAQRLAAGDYVSFVVWFNFLAGFAYIGAALGLFKRTKWSAHLALIIVLTTAIIFAALAVYIFTGGAFEARTVGAMVLRLGVWLVIAGVAHQNLLRKN